MADVDRTGRRGGVERAERPIDFALLKRDRFFVTHSFWAAKGLIADQ